MPSAESRLMNQHTVNPFGSPALREPHGWCPVSMAMSLPTQTPQIFSQAVQDLHWNPDTALLVLVCAVPTVPGAFLSCSW